MNTTIAIYLVCTLVGLMNIVSGAPARSSPNYVLRMVTFLVGIVAAIYGAIGLLLILVDIL